jgi:hypothetical protein
MSIAGVTRELLVRYLDTWAPAALHGARRATFALAWSGPADVAAAEAALRVFAEFTDRLRGRRLTVVLVAPAEAGATERLAAVQTELGTPPELGVHVVTGDPAERLGVALKAAGAAGAPLLVYADMTGAPPLDVVAAGRPAELFLVAAPGTWAGHREALRAAGFTLTAGVELVDGGDARLLSFASGSAKNLEAFKDAMWAVDEYAGVRYRDPGDPDGHLSDITLRPHPGPLRRELLAHLGTAGGRTLTELRHFTMTETIFRPSDTVRVVSALLAAGTVGRRPEHGRLSGDVLISLP